MKGKFVLRVLASVLIGGIAAYVLTASIGNPPASLFYVAAGIVTIASLLLLTVRARHQKWSRLLEQKRQQSVRDMQKRAIGDYPNSMSSRVSSRVKPLGSNPAPKEARFFVSESVEYDFGFIWWRWFLLLDLDERDANRHTESPDPSDRRNPSHSSASGEWARPVEQETIREDSNRHAPYREESSQEDTSSTRVIDIRDHGNTRETTERLPDFENHSEIKHAPDSTSHYQRHETVESPRESYTPAPEPESHRSYEPPQDHGVSYDNTTTSYDAPQSSE